MSHSNGNWMNGDQREAMRERARVVSLATTRLLLVDVCMRTPIEQDWQAVERVVKTWTDEQCHEASEWAIREHYHASDNPDVERLPVPVHVAELRRPDWRAVVEPTTTK